MVTFPLLCELSDKENGTTMEMGSHKEGKWIWNLHILSENIQVETKVQFDELQMILCDCEQTQNVQDNTIG